MSRPALSPLTLVCLTGAVLAAGGCTGKKETPTTPSSSSSSATVTQVQVTGTTSLTARSATSQLSATATLSNGSTRSVTQDATWTSSDTSVATVSGGLVRAGDVGDADIGATYQSVSASARVQVRYCALSFGSTGCGGMGVSVQINARTFALQLNECRCYLAYVADGSTNWRNFPFLCQYPTRICFGLCSGLRQSGAQLSRLPVLSNGVVMIRRESGATTYCPWTNLNMAQCLTDVNYNGECG